jgi:hypothetical protein
MRDSDPDRFFSSWRCGYVVSRANRRLIFPTPASIFPQAARVRLNCSFCARGRELARSRWTACGGEISPEAACAPAGRAVRAPKRCRATLILPRAPAGHLVVRRAGLRTRRAPADPLIGTVRLSTCPGPRRGSRDPFAMPPRRSRTGRATCFLSVGAERDSRPPTR